MRFGPIPTTPGIVTIVTGSNIVAGFRRCAHRPIDNAHPTSKAPHTMKLTPIIAAALTAFTTLTANAAVITWGAAQDISGDSDVITTGTLFAAVNLGPSGVLGTTINGVAFSPGEVVGGITTTTSQPFTSDYLTLLNTALRLDADTLLPATINGLTIGQDYAIQVWVNNSGRDFSGFSRGAFPTTVSDLDGNSVNLYPGDNGSGVGPGNSNLSAAPGQFVVGTFTADATSQGFQFLSEEINGVVNGLQLRAIAAAGPAPIPEPGTALFGLALAGAILTRRARRSR